MTMSLNDYQRLLRGKRCVICNRILPQKIEFYDHEYGWTVEGFSVKQWLYITCPCGYQNALWKLGVPRESNPPQAVNRLEAFSSVTKIFPTTPEAAANPDPIRLEKNFKPSPI